MNLMRLVNLLWVALAASTAARGDFSYIMTSKSGPGPGQTTRTSIKGQKMMIETSSTATILDFDAQTVTRINKSQSTYTVTKFADTGTALSGTTVTADVKETGQTKNIAGYDAKELVVNIDVDFGGRGMSAQGEVHIWVASGVPGAEERRAFYKRNGANFPWSAMIAGGNPSMAKTMADLQRKMAALDGVPVMEVIKIKMGGAAAGPSPDQQAKMDQARARLEQLAQQGGPQGDAAKQALARMGAAPGGGGMEITMEGSGFSTAAVPDSAFAIPAGFTKSDK